MARLWLTALCLFACMGCETSAPSDTPTDKKTAPKATQTDPLITPALDMLGDGAPVVGVFDGRSWPKVHQRLLPLAQQLPPAFQKQFADMKDLPGLLSALGRMGLGQKLDTLQGIDPKRPAVFALNEAMRSGPPGIALAAINLEKPNPLRHEIILPASDSAALERSLRALLGTMGKPHSAGFDMGELQVDVKAEGDWVRIAALMPATPDRVTQMWRTPQKPSARTPAFHRLASPGAGVAVLLRPWRLRVAYGQHGANQIMMAMASVGSGSSVRMPLFANGLAIVLNGAALMHASRPDFEDSVLRLVGDDAGVHFEGIHTLSATARPAFEQAIAKAGEILKLKNKALAYSRQRIDLRALLDGVGPRPVFAKVNRMRQFMRAWQECGFGCVLHTTFRVPLSTARGALDLAPDPVKQALRTLPTAVQFALIDIKKNGPVLALAADVPAGFDTGLLRKAGPLEVHLVPRGTRAVLMVGLQIDPRTVFESGATDPMPPMGDFTADLAAIAQKIRPLNAQVAQVLGGLGTLTGEARQVGAAFAWRLHLTTSPGVKRAPFQVVDTGTFKSPIHGFDTSEGDACLLKATRGAGALFDALANVGPENMNAMLAKGLEELEPDLVCAGNQPQTKPAVGGFYRLFTHLMTMRAESGDRASALPFIKAICEKSKDPWICAQPARLAAMPMADVPSVQGPFDPASNYPEAHRVHITPKGVFFENAPADLKALATGDNPAALVVDKTLTFAAAEPVFKALSGRKLQVEVKSAGRQQRFRIDRAYRMSSLPAPARPQPTALRAPDLKIDVLNPPPNNRLADLLGEPKTDARSLIDPTWYVSAQPGKVTVHKILNGEIGFDGPVQDGADLRAFLQKGYAAVHIDPRTPWPEAAQVLAVLGARARLTALPLPKPAETVLTVGTASANRDKQTIQRVIRSNQKQVKYCYQKQLIKNPKLAGKLFVAFEVQPDGSVATAAVEAPDDLKTVGECIQKRVLQWRFPAAANTSKVRYPFVFQSN